MIPHSQGAEGEYERTLFIFSSHCQIGRAVICNPNTIPQRITRWFAIKQERSDAVFGLRQLLLLLLIDKSRILKYLGHLAPEDMQRLDYALKNSLALNPLGSIRKLKPIIRSTAAYAPPEVVDGKPPVYPYTPIQSSFEDAGSVEEMMLYTELQSAVHAMIQRLEYSFTFNPSLLTIPKRKQQVSEILAEAEKYIWRMQNQTLY